MILAIRTDSEMAELQLLNVDGLGVKQKSWHAGRNLSKDLLSQILALLSSVKADFADLKGVVVYEGPGSFTGLRIGISVANALGYSLNVPITGATGQNWVKQSIAKLANAKPGQFVVPKYGAEPNITKPRK